MNHITNNKLDNLSITWEISNKCNYNCWYCPEELHNGSTGWPNLQKSIDFFNNLSQKHPGIHVDLIGGEPTLWPKIDEFVDNIGNNISIEITTNGSRTLRWWNALSSKIKNITISVHLDTASPDHIIEVCKILKSKVNLSVLILFDPVHRLTIETLIMELKKLNVSYSTKLIFPQFKGKLYDYTDEELEFCKNSEYFIVENLENNKPYGFKIDGVQKKIKNDVLSKSLNSFTGWACRAGIKRLHIDFSGNIYSGSCRSYKLGNINDNFEDIKFPNNFIICNIDVCTCVDDIKVEKWTLNNS